MDRQNQGLIYGGVLISDGPGERLSKHVTFPKWLGSTETGSVRSYIADEDAWQYSLQQYEEIRTAFTPQNLRIDLQIINAFLHPQRKHMPSSYQKNNSIISRTKEQQAMPLEALVQRPSCRLPKNQTPAQSLLSPGRRATTPYLQEFYDQQPLSYGPEVPSFVITAADPRAAAMEEMMTIVVARGWNKTPPKD